MPFYDTDTHYSTTELEIIFKKADSVTYKKQGFFFVFFSFRIINSFIKLVSKNSITDFDFIFYKLINVEYMLCSEAISFVIITLLWLV